MQCSMGVPVVEYATRKDNAEICEGYELKQNKANKKTP